MHSVFPVAYFGNLVYFKSLLNAKEVVFDVHEYFVKQTLRSRCEIQSANGRIQLNIPVSKPNGSKTKMIDIEISYATDWQRIHWKAIESAYASSPYFEDYATEIYDLIFSNSVSLVDFNMRTIQMIVSRLDLVLDTKFSSEYIAPTECNDFRMREFNLPSSAPTYIQVFSDKSPFEPNLSILDILFCEGPIARKWLLN
ncbi:MAG: WbqC family protein [Flavobacteriia bacterium]|jgi:hypothetical protein